MEEFKNLCAGLTGAPEIIATIKGMNFQDAKGSNHVGVDCLQPMADDIQKLNKAE